MERGCSSLALPGLRGSPPGSPRRRVSPSPGPCWLLSLRAPPGAPADWAPGARRACRVALPRRRAASLARPRPLSLRSAAAQHLQLTSRKFPAPAPPRPCSRALLAACGRLCAAPGLLSRRLSGQSRAGAEAEVLEEGI